MTVSKALFKQQITDLISGYVDNYIGNDENPQIRVVPAGLAVDIVSGSDFLDEIAESDEVIEMPLRRTPPTIRLPVFPISTNSANM